MNNLIQKTTESMIEYIDKTSKLLIDELGIKISDKSYRKIFYFLFRNFIGLNKIEPIMKAADNIYFHNSRLRQRMLAAVGLA